MRVMWRGIHFSWQAGMEDQSGLAGPSSTQLSSLFRTSSKVPAALFNIPQLSSDGIVTGPYPSLPPHCPFFLLTTSFPAYLFSLVP